MSRSGATATKSNASAEAAKAPHRAAGHNVVPVHGCGSSAASCGNAAKHARRFSTRLTLHPKTSTPQMYRFPSPLTFPEFPIQRKLSIGATDDPMEREADRVADNVVRRKCDCGGTCADCQKDQETTIRRWQRRVLVFPAAPRGRSQRGELSGSSTRPRYPIVLRAAFRPRSQPDRSAY